MLLWPGCSAQVKEKKQTCSEPSTTVSLRRCELLEVVSVRYLVTIITQVNNVSCLTSGCHCYVGRIGRFRVIITVWSWNVFQKSRLLGGGEKVRR